MDDEGRRNGSRPTGSFNSKLIILLLCEREKCAVIFEERKERERGKDLITGDPITAMCSLKWSLE